mmetsp:Transcript_124204/g.345742  ORF Transcript_124204/g.345742 Transcript_124204/m.345742 type:complete len:226 (+) Transcript_124204:855-1532(+)
MTKKGGVAAANIFKMMGDGPSELQEELQAPKAPISPSGGGRASPARPSLRASSAGADSPSSSRGNRSSRAGGVEIYDVPLPPSKQLRVWQERLARECWDHPFHAGNQEVNWCSYRGMTTTTQDAFSGPVRIMDRRVLSTASSADTLNRLAASVRSASPASSSRSPIALVGDARAMRPSRSSSSLAPGTQLAMAQTLPPGGHRVVGDTGGALCPSRMPSFARIYGT